MNWKVALASLFLSGAAYAGLGDGKPMTPSAITVAIESCQKASPDNGVDPGVQLAFCACNADYLDGLDTKAALAVMKGINDGKLPASYLKALKKCGTWSAKHGDITPDRTPYSRRKIASAMRTMQAYLGCDKTEIARSKTGRDRIEYCDRLVAQVRAD